VSDVRVAGGSAPSEGAELEREALRLNDRYLREAVIAFGLCPWAERAISGGELRRHVVAGDAEPSLAAVLAFIDELARAGGAVSVAMLIFARAAVASPAFDRFTEEVRRADRERCRAEGRKDFVMAAFHPEAATTFSNRYQLVSYLRRTPDPTIQLVRAELLDPLRAARPSLSDDIAEQNFARVNAQGPGLLDRVLRDIRRDRDETYATLTRATVSISVSGASSA
jgi:hypothetical protein